MSDRVRLEFWCDESSHTIGRFMLVGGLLVRSEQVRTINDMVSSLKQITGEREEKEIKWSTYKKHQSRLYGACAAAFGAMISTKMAHYHLLAFDNHSIDARQFPGATNASVLSRMYYQLFLHRCAKLYGGDCDIHLRPDGSNELDQLPRLLTGLNNDARQRFRLSKNPVLDIKPQKSDKHGIMQLNDVILGAVAYKKNRRHERSDAAPHKCHLADQIQRNLGLETYDLNTRVRPGVTLWNFQTQK